MESKRQNAVTLLFMGLIMVFDAGVNLIGITGWVSDYRRYVFMVALFIAGILVTWAGCARLWKLKHEKPEQSWWQFGKVELIIFGLLLTGFLTLFLLPEETRENIQATLRELLEASHAIRGN
jgi:hypothetical protein